MILEIAGMITLIALGVLLVIGTIFFVSMCFDNDNITKSNRSKICRIEDDIEYLKRQCKYVDEKFEGFRTKIKNV